MSKKYAVVTTIETFRHRYVVEMEDGETDPYPCADFVVCDEVEEFSQHWLGKQIVDISSMSKEDVVAQFDKDHIENDSEIFLGWTDEQKLKNVFIITK